MFLIKIWNCHISSKSTGCRLSAVESAEQIQRGKQNRLCFPTQREHLFSKKEQNTQESPFNVFMCTERVGNLDIQPVAQSQHISEIFKS